MVYGVTMIAKSLEKNSGYLFCYTIGLEGGIIWSVGLFIIY